MGLLVFLRIKPRSQQFVVGLTNDEKLVTFATITGEKFKDVTHLISDIVQHIYFDSQRDKLQVVHTFITSWCAMHGMSLCWSVRVHRAHTREAMAIPVISFQRGIVTWYYQKQNSYFNRTVVGCVTRIPELHAWPIITLQQHIAQMMIDMHNNGDDNLSSTVLRKRK